MEPKLKMAKKETGYAWFVVFCSFALNFITDGVAYTFGIFFSELLHEFESSKAAGSWVPSIMTGLTFCVGPVVSALTNRYGCRTISMAGTTLAAVGYLLSTFALNVSTLYFTIGVMAGAGFGLIYLPCIVIITQYFSSRLALATGLAVSAAGIGSAVFAPVTEYLIRRFGWRVAMQVVALTLFISGLFALSFKDLEYDDTSTDYDEEDTSVYDELSKQKIVKFNEKDDLCAEEEKLMKNDNLVADKLCNGNALTKQNKIQLSQSSLNSVTSNEQHNRIINSHLNRATVADSLDERSEQQENEMLIPITEQETGNELDEYPEQGDEDEYGSDKVRLDRPSSGGGENDEMEPSGAPESRYDASMLNTSNLLTNNLATSLNTNLNNLNNVARTNEIPRLSLDSSANYRLHQQLQQHHLQLKKDDLANLQSNQTINEDTNNNLASDQDLNESQASLASQPTKQSQYKSLQEFNSLHPNFNVSTANPTTPTAGHATRKYSSKGSNLNTIVLYSTSMTSINYCCGNDPTKEPVCSKHNSISSQKLTSVLTPLHKESTGSAAAEKRLIVQKSYSKEKEPTYFELKRRYTLEKIVTVGNLLKILLSWNLLRDRIFLWFAISNFLTSLGYYVPYFYTKERCLLLPDMSPNSTDCSFLLSIIGFSSTIGRILFGFISDFHQCNRIYIYAHCLTVCGLSTMMTMFAVNYSLLAVFCVLFGLTTGAFVSLTTVIIVDLLGPDRVSNAFGLLLLFQGLASLCGPPIVGLLFDYTYSYDPGFVLIGLAIVISGAMLYFVPCIKKKEKADQYGIANS